MKKSWRCRTTPCAPKVLSDEAVVFKAGSANLLGRFSVAGKVLHMELAHVDGGGEGALPKLAALAQRFARREGLTHIEWRVHAVHCAKPNLKLRRVLVRRGFTVRLVDGVGECYWALEPVTDQPTDDSSANG